MDDKECLEDFEKDVKWLRDHVPLDDIYEFSQQLLMASEFFLGKRGECTEVQKLFEEDELLLKWARNIFNLQRMKDADYQGIISVSWKRLKK